MRVYFQDGNLNYTPMVGAVIYNSVKTKRLSLRLVADTGFQAESYYSFKHI